MSLFAELRRRNVIRVAGLYVVTAWILVQIADTMLPVFEAPPWVMKVLVGMLALGFIPALVFSWVYELTPGGLKRERDVDRSQSVVDQTARKLDMAVIVMLLGVGGLMLWTNAQRPADAGATAAANAATASVTSTAPTPAPAPITDKTIAVLPFADFSQQADQGWFADGLTEEILNALARTPDLLVSARTSSFKYKGSTLAIPQIATELGVAHVLEGSVRGDSKRIRVTAQLIRAADGFHLWSQTYDRDTTDVISIQEDLARQIAIAMQTSMDPEALADMARVGTRSVEAYQAYLRGVAASLVSDPGEFRRGYQQFEKARALDPGFAAAHARAANYWLAQLDPTLTISGSSDVSPQAMREHFRERIDLAIEHATNNTDRYVSMALKALLELRLRDAIGLQRRVLAERPMDREALVALLDLLTRTSQADLMQEPLDKIWSLALERPEWANANLNFAHRGPDRVRAADQALELARRWPDEESNLYQAHRALLWDGRTAAAREVFERWRQLGNQSQWARLPAARQASAEGHCDEVEQTLAALEPGDIPQRWHVLMMLGRHEEAKQLLMPLEQSGNVQALAGFLSYPQFDPSPFPSLMRVLEREGVHRPPPVDLPFACKTGRSGS